MATERIVDEKNMGEKVPWVMCDTCPLKDVVEVFEVDGRVCDTEDVNHCKNLLNWVKDDTGIL